MTTRIGRSAGAALPDRDQLATWMAAISWGRAAERLEPAAKDVVVLPVTERLVVNDREVESRLLWQQGVVVAVGPEAAAEVSWSHTENGFDHTPHRCVLRIRRGTVTVDGDWPSADPPDLVSGGRPALIERGRLAEWSMLTGLERFVRKQLHRASTRIATELDARNEIDLYNMPDAPLEVVDGLTIDTLASGMLYGEDGPNPVPPITRTLIRRYADAEPCSLRVPLSTWLTRNISAQATGRIRSAIGDSMLGPRIRRVAASLGRDVTPEQVLEQCRTLQIGGNEPLGIQRVRDALLVPFNVAARTRTGSLNELPMVADPRSDEPFEHVDSAELVRAYRDHSGIDDPDLLWLSFEFEVEGRVSVDRDRFWHAARRLQLSDR